MNINHQHSDLPSSSFSRNLSVVEVARWMPSTLESVGSACENTTKLLLPSPSSTSQYSNSDCLLMFTLPRLKNPPMLEPKTPGNGMLCVRSLFPKTFISSSSFFYSALISLSNQKLANLASRELALGLSFASSLIKGEDWRLLLPPTFSFSGLQACESWRMVSTMSWQSVLVEAMGCRQQEQRRLTTAGWRLRTAAQGQSHYQNILLKLKHTRLTSLSISSQSSLSALLAAQPVSNRYSVSRRQSLLSQLKHSSSPTASSFSTIAASSTFHRDYWIITAIIISQISFSSSSFAVARSVLYTGSRAASGHGNAMARRMGSTLPSLCRWYMASAREQ